MRPSLLVLVLAWPVACLGAGEDRLPPPREHLERILRRPPYQRWRRRETRPETEPETGLMRSIRQTLQRWREWLAEKLDQWFGREPGLPEPAARGSEGPGLAVRVLKLLGYVGLAALAVFLAFLAYRLIRERRRGGPAARVVSRERVRDALESGEALALGGPQWLAEAERLAREGDFRSVYRALYLALLSGLHERRKIDFRKSRTNWHYVRRFRGEEGEREVFTSLTSLFDRVWYGQTKPQGTSLATVRAQVSRLLATEGGRA
ncbi:MAG: DUF4129 domain-containing protein [Candidatus Brocadiia bacterium]